MSDTDPFGASRRERLMRRLCGASAATVILGAFLIWLPTAVLFVAAAVYVVGLPAALVVEALWPANTDSSQPSLIGRYVGLGALLGAVVGTILSAPDFTWLLLNLTSFLVGGAVGGGVAAWAALNVPGRWVLPTAAVGPLAVAAVASWVLWLGPPLL